MKKGLEEKCEKDVAEMSFVERYQKDRKYKAKVQLIGYGVFLVILIIYLNIASMGSQAPLNSILPGDSMGTNQENTSKELEDWIKKLGNNYEYDIEVLLKMEGEEEARRERYVGKRNGQDALVRLESVSFSEEYLRVDKLYYKKSEGNYFVVSDKEIYPLLDKEYVELDGWMTFLSLAKLDHMTNYSNGKREYVYHLLVRDFVKSHQSDEVVVFTVSAENDEVVVEVSYTELLKARGMSVLDGKVVYHYTNIGKVLAFETLEKKSGEE